MSGIERMILFDIICFLKISFINGIRRLIELNKEEKEGYHEADFLVPCFLHSPFPF
jgi:hypothetical protein